MNIKRLFVWGTTLLVVVSAIVLVVPRVFSSTPQPVHGILLQSPQPLDNFTLTNTDNEQVQLSDLAGKYLLVYFGYTFCPDVCPMTLSDLQKTVQALGEQAEQVQVMMISVDPERDTPERLKTYMTAFDPSFMGLTGSQEDLAAIASTFGVFYEKHEGSAATKYLVDHTATVIVVDPEGYIRLVFPFGTSGEAMADDLRPFLGK